MTQLDNHTDTLAAERRNVLEQVEDWLETPLLILAFVWLALMVSELIWGLSPILEAAGVVIWIVFIVDFLIKFVLAPDKSAYLRSHWLTAIALVVPALRIFRVFRVFRMLRLVRTTRGLRLVRVVTSVNRGMRALGESLDRRGFGYVVLLTVLVTFAGAAGMYAFGNHNPDGRGLTTYGAALWWTGMMMTTMGSEYWPQTAEGRILCLLLSLYAFAVFGYVTATLATYFVGRDAASEQGELPSAEAVRELRAEIAALRHALGRPA